MGALSRGQLARDVGNPRAARIFAIQYGESRAAGGHRSPVWFPDALVTATCLRFGVGNLELVAVTGAGNCDSDGGLRRLLHLQHQCAIHLWKFLKGVVSAARL